MGDFPSKELPSSGAGESTSSRSSRKKREKKSKRKSKSKRGGKSIAANHAATTTSSSSSSSANSSPTSSAILSPLTPATHSPELSEEDNLKARRQKILTASISPRPVISTRSPSQNSLQTSASEAPATGTTASSTAATTSSSTIPTNHLLAPTTSNVVTSSSPSSPTVSPTFPSTLTQCVHVEERIPFEPSNREHVYSTSTKRAIIESNTSSTDPSDDDSYSDSSEDNEAQRDVVYDQEYQQLLQFLEELRSLVPQELYSLGRELARRHPGLLDDLRATIKSYIENRRKSEPSEEEKRAAASSIIRGIIQVSSDIEDMLSSVGLNWDWNEHFQRAIDRNQKHDSIFNERIKTYSELCNLAQDFANTAKTYGRIIISEVELPYHQKTIKPRQLGGLAGGAKFIVNKILFKFAVDSADLYEGSDIPPLKVAGHELKGLINYINLDLSNVYYPMMALVDYMGFRLIAMSLLPIDKETIIYGSNDAGMNYHDEYEYFTNQMRIAAAKLNLKPHKTPSGSSIYSAIDIEGHRGQDGKFYLIDFARAFPPAKTNPKFTNGHIYQLLRPEFVRKYCKPLCPDTYSKFLPDENEAMENEKECEEATDYLLKEVIPTFAMKIQDMSVDDPEFNSKLVNAAHREGINIRYFGYLRSCVASPHLKNAILVEVLARVIKQEIRLTMRNTMKRIKLALEHQCRKVVISLLNVIFGGSKASSDYWDNHLVPLLNQNFENSLSPEEAKQSLKKIFEEKQLLCHLFVRVQTITLLTFTATVQQEFGCDLSSFKAADPFDEMDLEEIGVGVRDLNIMAIAQGYVLKQKAAKAKTGKDDDTAKKLAKQAMLKFEEALKMNPDDKRALRELADSARISGNNELADQYYRRAIATDQKDPNLHFKYAVFLEQINRRDAEREYLAALELDPANSHCLQLYATFLESLGLDEEAERFFVRASECRSINTLNNQAGASGSRERS
eukprot:TRINITY_DN4255_c0_g2_i1.p1 TRINITY_DN4255_c0_g2~~TRINITY_DN4255_c0_g2_i1.p1  ORF type:complete len:961 (+),score=234.00 TRINITY_DN4255_c0_g2_i1:195-3077(+)